MSTVWSSTPPAFLRNDGARSSRAWVDPPPTDLGDPARFTEFAALLSAYRRSGGTTRGDDLACLLEERLQGDYVSLARLIVGGDIFGFEWRRTLWIPMFQFDPRTLSVHSGPRQVLAELNGVFDGWELATWFITQNDWLADQRPVDLLDIQLPKVLEAARSDRFIAAG